MPGSKLSAKRWATNRKTANARYLPHDTGPISAGEGSRPVEVSRGVTYRIAYGKAAVVAASEVVKVSVGPAAAGGAQFKNVSKLVGAVRAGRAVEISCTVHGELRPGARARITRAGPGSAEAIDWCKGRPRAWR